MHVKEKRKTLTCKVTSSGTNVAHSVPTPEARTLPERVAGVAERDVPGRELSISNFLFESFVRSEEFLEI